MAKDRPPSYQWYPRDFRAEPAVDAMTFDQRGRYQWALDASWLTESYGVAPEDQWRQWMHYTVEEWVDVRDVYAPCFKAVRGGWMQKRMAEERAAQVERHGQAQKGAFVTNEKRWSNVAQRSHSGRPSVSLASAFASETEKESKDLVPDGTVVISIPHKGNGNGSGNGDGEKGWAEMFDWFWESYPRKVGKPAAVRAWRGVKPQSQDTVDAINDGMGRWEGAWAGKDRSFIPHPATFLNQRRWEDQP